MDFGRKLTCVVLAFIGVILLVILYVLCTMRTGGGGKVVGQAYDIEQEVTMCYEGIEDLRKEVAKQASMREEVKTLAKKIDANNKEIVNVKKQMIEMANQIRIIAIEIAEDVSDGLVLVPPGRSDGLIDRPIQRIPMLDRSYLPLLGIILAVLAMLVAVMRLLLQLYLKPMNERQRYRDKTITNIIEGLMRKVRHDQFFASTDIQKRDEVAHAFSEELAIMLDRLKVIGGNPTQVSTGANNLSFRGDHDEDADLLRTARKRDDLPRETKGALKRAINGLKNRSQHGLDK